MAVDSLIQDLGGVWSRPFVSDGDPLDAAVVIIGLNPATPIPSSMPKSEYIELLKNRARFEEYYIAERRRRGKRDFSTTRKRLRLVRESFPDRSFLETNVNAYATKNAAELKQKSKAAYCQAGNDIAAQFLASLRPELIIVHGQDAIKQLTGNEMLSLGPPSPTDSNRVEVFHHAMFNGHPVTCLRIPHLAARGLGITDSLFSSLGRYI